MEIFQLRWENILWDQGRMLVTIPKTKHHVGKESRFVPIGDILPWLEAEYDQAPEGTQRVITRFGETNENLAKPFEKIIEAAGLTVWPKLIQNLRASCDTDWLDSGIPAHVVAKWIGHSVKVQNDNYAQVDDHHFDQLNSDAYRQRLAAESAQLDKNCPTTSVGDPMVGQQRSETTKPDKRRKQKNPAKTNVLRGSADSFGNLRSGQVPEAGVLQTAFQQGFKALSEIPGAQPGAIDSSFDLQGQLRQQALDALQFAWKSLRRLEDLSDDPRESKAAGKAVKHVDKAFAELEVGKQRFSQNPG